MKLKLFVTTILVLALGLNAAEAQPVQRHRIRQGIRSGEVTRSEARTLSLEQRKFRHDRRMARRDGVITRRERKALRMERRHNNRAIYRRKHNRRNRI